MNYDDVYYQRVTQWGRTYQERTKNQREELFRRYMVQSVYKVSFYDDENEFIPVEILQKQFFSLTSRMIQKQYGACLQNQNTLILLDAFLR